MRIGLVSDTHGTLRPELFEHFEGVDRILHAGDVGSPDLLIELEALAPVTAVWGNTDGFELRERVPETATLELEGRHMLVTHGHRRGSPTPTKLREAHRDADIIVFGHTHEADVDRSDERLVINPGAAGPARFRLTPSLGILTLAPDQADVRIVEL